MHQPGGIGLSKLHPHFSGLQIVQQCQHVLRAEEVFMTPLQCRSLGTALSNLLQKVKRRLAAPVKAVIGGGWDLGN